MGQTAIVEIHDRAGAMAGKSRAAVSSIKRSLFADAIDALLALQALPMDAPLPRYDEALLRREVENQLRRALAEQPAPDSVVGDWLLLASSILFFALLLGAGVLTLFRFLRP